MTQAAIPQWGLEGGLVTSPTPHHIVETERPASSAPCLEASDSVEADAARGHIVGDGAATAAVGGASPTFSLVVL
jgi:hypothetical protein